MGALTKESKWAGADKAHAKGMEAYIEFGRECAKLNAEGTTQSAIGERYGMSQQSVNEIVKVGNDIRLLTGNTGSLPRSTYSLYLLTTLDDEGFELLAKPDTTQADILAVKAGYSSVEEQKKAKKFLQDWQDAINENRSRTLAAKEVEKLKLEAEKREKEQEYIPPPRRAVGGREFLLQCFQDLLSTDSPVAIKAVKSMFSSLYHPDSGKLRKDNSLMSEINQAIDSLS